jgi:hypothetical protein
MTLTMRTDCDGAAAGAWRYRRHQTTVGEGQSLPTPTRHEQATVQGVQELDADAAHGIRPQHIFTRREPRRDGVTGSGARASDITTRSETCPLKEAGDQAPQSTTTALGHAAKESLGDLLRRDAIDGREHGSSEIPKRVGGRFRA